MILNEVIDYFKNSVIFTKDFFIQYSKTLKDPQKNNLVYNLFKTSNIFSSLLLAYKIVETSNIEKNSAKFLKFKDLRDRIVHYSRSNVANIKNNPYDLKKITELNNTFINTFKSFDLIKIPATVQKTTNKVLFSFLGSGNYRELNYKSDDLGTVHSKFLGNSLIKLLKEKNVVTYVVLGTYTSDWKVFIDTFIETLGDNLECLSEIKRVFYSYLKTKKKYNPRLNTNDFCDVIDLNKDSVKKINSLFLKYKSTLKVDVQIYAYDEKEEYKCNFSNIVNFINAKISNYQSFLMDITHSFRDIPLVALLSSILVSSGKKAKLEKLYYGYVDPNIRNLDNNNIYDGYLVDLSYLVDMIFESKNVSMFGDSANLKYLKSIFERTFSDNSEILNKIIEAYSFENSMLFQLSGDYYKDILDFVRTYDNVENLDPIYKLIKPLFDEKLEKCVWENNILGLKNRADFYLKNGFFSHAICAIYESYKKFTDELLILDKSYFNVYEKFSIAFKDYHNYIATKKYFGIEMSKYEKKSRIASDILKYSMKENSNLWDDLKELRRFITNEISNNKIKDFEKNFLMLNSKITLDVIEKKLAKIINGASQLNYILNKFKKVVEEEKFEKKQKNC